METVPLVKGLTWFRSPFKQAFNTNLQNVVMRVSAHNQDLATHFFIASRRVLSGIARLLSRDRRWRRWRRIQIWRFGHVTSVGDSGYGAAQDRSLRCSQRRRYRGHNPSCRICSIWTGSDHIFHKTIAGTLRHLALVKNSLAPIIITLRGLSYQ